MKGRIYSRFPAARIVDLTHEILVHWPAEAGFWLTRSFEYFPPGTVHVAVVDPGVGTAREIVMVSARGHVLLAPDNGLLAPVVGRHPEATIHRFDATRSAGLGLGRPSATFHGRDIFAPLAAEIAAGRRTPADLGTPVDTLVPSWIEEPSASAEVVSGIVMALDHFGNLITNIDSALIGRFVEPHVYAGNRVIPFRRTYGDARPGDLLALVNSVEVVEIARAEGSAAESLGLSRGAPVVVRDAVRRT
jgi:S-adenosylmethionine hydrolase